MYEQTFGQLKDDKAPAPRRREPTTEIGRFYAARNEVITHWCKPCRRWHGPSCFQAFKAAQRGEQ